MPSPHRAADKTRGFTLVELLVVITILALLLGLAAVNFSDFLGQGDKAATVSRIEGLKLYLTQYKSHMGDYPASRLADHGVKGGDNMFEGIEALVIALKHKDYAYDGPEEAWLQNMDADQGQPNVTQFAKSDLFEVVDAWDNPIVYMRYDDYERAQNYEFMNQDTMALEDVEVKAATSEKTGTFHDARSYQLRSAGKDGVLNTPDDITSYN